MTFPSGLVVVLFPLHLPLSSFSLGTNTVSRFSRKDINILRFPVWEKQVPLLVPPEVRCGSILVCHCTDERAGGKDRLGFVEWSSQEIKSGLSTFWEGVGLTFTVRLSIYSSSEFGMGLRLGSLWRCGFCSQLGAVG